MKDTIITTRRKRIELWTLLTCFLIGNLANLYAIISYKTPFFGNADLDFLCSGIFLCALCFFGPCCGFLFYGIRSLLLKKAK